jgi:tetratricopeptide (TPR) repeat protein
LDPKRRRRARRALLIILAVVALEPLYRGLFAVRRLLASDDGAFEVYAVGESTMTGYPYQERFSLSSLALAPLAGKVRGAPIRVIDLAQAGESVYPQATALEHAVRSRGSSRPGLVLVYSGNNDVGLPVEVSRLERFREAVLSHSMLLRDLWYFGERHNVLPRTRNLATYGFFLKRIVDESRAHGLTPILSTVVSNQGDYDPGIGTICRLERKDVDAALRDGEAAEARADWRAAVAAYESRRRGDRLEPYLDFRIGKCQEQLGDFEAARASFRRALDGPTCNPFLRATSRQNELVRALAREEGVPLVDAERIFEARSPHGILGDSLFSDGQHPNLDGYALLASVFSDEIYKALDLPAPPPQPRPQLTATQEAAADAVSGSWLLTVSFTHDRPADRLRRARDDFERAVKLDPANFRGWLGLGLTQAAQGGFLERKENLEFLAEHHLYYGDLGRKMRRDAIPLIVQKLGAAGVPRATLDAITATAPSDDIRLQ